MFVNPSSAFVGKPSLVASSSGSAKYARYARLLPSTRKSSESRAGASSRSSSRPVSVFGDIASSLRRGPGPLSEGPRRRSGGPQRQPQERHDRQRETERRRHEQRAHHRRPTCDAQAVGRCSAPDENAGGVVRSSEGEQEEHRGAESGGAVLAE